jgi:hypothetical protein
MLAGVSTERSGMSTIICIEEIKPQSFVIINPLNDIIIMKKLQNNVSEHAIFIEGINPIL